jgi:2-methylcitrate dehydratase PrpD
MTEGWFATQLLGFFSGTAVAGRLLGLNEEQMLNALGIAFTQVSGSREMAVGAATHIRGMQGGFSGQGSILAAMLAQRGIIGSKNSLEGRYGLYQVYLHTRPNREVIIGKLGTHFPTLENHGFKPWPSCGATHSIIDAILRLREAHAIKPGDVEEVVIIGGDMHTQLLSEPLELKRKPKISMDAKYSIPFTSAVALTRGNVTLKDYTDAGLNDREVLVMAQKVRHQVVPQEQKTSLIPVVEIHTRDGKVFSEQVEHPLGRAQNPLTRQHLESKFRDCVSFSAKSISQANIERVIELIGKLETLPDATDIVRLLA